ncbi:hypothetical protein PKB_1753 [Pseudomonas knackmussii B13]|uniref:Uncharacterized protein n=1 Tax=Pseudomonas knackmussii (strain DSM 6978 / CCUG 54928 / LMG 23759 / B13) TaxID=1301098 RepID=A0A024HE48_PSEKB|nr:hypothetical protein [Pseudomonas knackmussii]CDF83111.1 hypothetical protein PKB_1753 [Pseudomonas knackmussii B13]
MNKELIEQTLTKAGIALPPIIKSLIESSIDRNYVFACEDEFNKLPPSEIQKTYWKEIIYRAHWAATSSLIRTKKWLDACNSAIEGENYIAFCSSMRGLLESTTDAYSALGSVPLTLAEVSAHIAKALQGNELKSVVISEELEDALIHFIFARKLSKNEKAPKSHNAKTASSMIDELDSANLPFKNFYSDLCQIVHPAAQSIDWLINEQDGVYTIAEPKDIDLIKSISGKYQSCIEQLILYPTNISIFIYQVINELPVPELVNTYAKSINSSASPLHEKINRAFTESREKFGS